MLNQETICLISKISKANAQKPSCAAPRRKRHAYPAKRIISPKLPQKCIPHPPNNPHSRQNHNAAAKKKSENQPPFPLCSTLHSLTAKQAVLKIVHIHKSPYKIRYPLHTAAHNSHSQRFRANKASGTPKPGKIHTQKNPSDTPARISPKTIPQTARTQTKTPSRPRCLIPSNKPRPHRPPAQQAAGQIYKACPKRPSCTPQNTPFRPKTTPRPSGRTAGPPRRAERIKNQFETKRFGDSFYSYVHYTKCAPPSGKAII